MAFDAQIVPEVYIEVLEGLASAADPVPEALTRLAAHLPVPLNQVDAHQYVGVILVDGLSGSEERLMESLGDRTDLTFIGGSAGDDLQFKATHVFAHGRSYPGSALLALLHVPRGFEIIKTQSFATTDRTLVASEVCESTREVVAFDGQPAAAAYAAALGVPLKDLSTEFLQHPLGLMAAGNEPFVRSPQQVVENGVRFYCAVRQGMPLQVLSAVDMLDDTRAALADVASAGEVQGVVNFHCILRTLDLEGRGQTDAYGRLFDAIPTVGFSTYGEQYIGHVNQTATMLVLR